MNYLNSFVSPEPFFTHSFKAIKDNTEAELVAEVPGCSREEVTVELLEESVLLITANSKRLSKKVFTSYVPSGFDANAAVANVENGLLTIKLPALKQKKRYIQLT